MPDSFSPNGNFIRKEVPSFDAIRGIAILLVVAAHAGFGPEQAFSLYPSGVLGVDIFMVLSGFLIVSALLKDFELCGTIRFKKFYSRRAARIFPALFSFLLTCWAISLLFPTLISHDTFVNAGFGALTFSLNLAMVSNCTWWQPLAHLWSLSLEEQFYLILPLALALLMRVRSSAVWVGVAAIPIIISIVTRLQGCLMHSATDICWNIKLAHGSAAHFIGQGVGAAFGCLWRFGWVDVHSARTCNLAKAAIFSGALYLIAADLVGLRASCVGLDPICLFTLGLIVVSLNSDTSTVSRFPFFEHSFLN
jgi:peptidoglycan/LPS O-acetylase OafA/YrhL